MKRRLATIVAIAAGVAPTAIGAVPAVAQASPMGTSATASVIGGRPASIAEFPWLAFIVGKNEDGPLVCTGAVVAPRVILTAGHCIEKPKELAANPASSYRVVTGIADIGAVSAANVSTVSRALFYPNFETAKPRIDAGLLILPAPVAAPALRVATRADAALLQAGTPVSIAGWGVTRPKDKRGPNVLQTGQLVVKAPSACRRSLRPFEPFYSAAGQFCAIDTPDHTVSGCFGDSGGPVIAVGADGAPVELGIVVSGGAGCKPKLPNIYTRVDKVSPWVRGWIASIERGAPPPPVPKADPPYLTFERAKELGVVALRKTFRDRFRGVSPKETRCRRLDWAKVRCRVAWRLGRSRYRGTVTISYAVKGYAVSADADVSVRVAHPSIKR